MQSPEADRAFAHLTTEIQQRIDEDHVPGLALLVSHRDQVHLLTRGSFDLDGKHPIQRDTIFRISSMTKPVTAAATLMLIEAGTLQLDEPVDRLLPELANRRVLRKFDSALDDTEPARRAITVRDLLTFRMGFGQ